MLGLAIGLLSLAVAFSVAYQSWDSWKIAAQAQRSGASPGYAREFETESGMAMHLFSASTASVPLSGLLVVAAAIGSKGKSYSIGLYCLYAVAQIIAGLIFAVAMASDLMETPGGPLFYLGAVPGLIECIYPAFVLIHLLATM